MMSPSATASTGSVERGRVGKTPTSGCARPSATGRLLMASGWSRMSMSRCPSTRTAATERRSTSSRSRSPALGGSREGTRWAIVRCSRKEALMNHNDAVRLFAKTLQNVERWMDKAAAHAKAKSFEVDVLAQARLAPDQYPLVRQVQSACDQAKYAAAYLGGKPAPSHPDTEQTFAELRQRIRKCLGFLETVQAKDLAGAEDRKVSPPWLGGKWLRGDGYLVHVALPNFFFHATMAYAILRHKGVDLGKMDYIGSIPTKEG